MPVYVLQAKWLSVQISSCFNKQLVYLLTVLPQYCLVTSDYLESVTIHLQLTFSVTRQNLANRKEQHCKNE